MRVFGALLVLALAGLFGCSSSSDGATSSSGPAAPGKTTYVLVHGGWHGPWAWDKVRPLLEAAGDDVITPTLPAHGSDTTKASDATLEGYTQAVVDAVDAAEGDVVLVGHSMAGAIISQVAEARPGRIKLLVYLAAVLLEDGQTVTTRTGHDPESVLGKNIDFLSDGTLAIKPEAVREALYEDCTDEDVAWAAAQLGHEPLGPLITGIQVSDERWGKVPRAYIHTENDKAIGPTSQTAMYTELPCDPVVSMASSHSPFLCHPEAFVEVLHGLGGE